MQVRWKARGNQREKTQDQIAEWMRSKDEYLNLPVATVCFVQFQQLKSQGCALKETAQETTGLEENI